MQIKDQISKWKEELLTPTSNDVLVNLHPEKNAFSTEHSIAFELSIQVAKDRLINKMYREHRTSIKESGTPIFGVCQNIISFKIDGTQYNSPLQIASCSLKQNRLSKVFEITQTEPFYLNPFLTKLFDISEEKELDEITNQLDQQKIAYEIQEKQWFANFHPHRFILVKELERIENQKTFSSSIRTLLNNEGAENSKIQLHEGELFSTDQDQLQVFHQVEKENTVVQGPPGTGKSQVIANLMGKLLAGGDQGLLIAEKKVALDVIYEKLKEKQLHHFCLLHHHQLNAKDFIHSLKETWTFLESRKKSGRPFQRASKLALDGLELTLDRLRQPDLISGISFSECKSKIEQIDRSSAQFFSRIPDIPTWKKEKSSLEKIEASIESKDNFWTYLKSKCHSLPIEEIEKVITDMVSWIKQFDDLTITREKIEQMIRKAGIAELFFYDDLLVDLDLFEKNSNKQKRFIKLKDRLTGLEEEIERLKEEKKHWDKNFSLSELNEYIETLSSTSPFDLKSKFQRRKLLKYTDLNLSDAISTLENLVTLKKKEEKYNKTKRQLRKLGVSPDRGQLTHIEYVIRSLQQVDENLVQSLFKLDPKELTKYRQQAKLLNKLTDAIRSMLNIEENTPVYPILEKIKNRMEILAKLQHYFEKISNETSLIWRETGDLKTTESSIYLSHWRKFEGRFPQLAKSNNDTICQRIEEIISFKKQEEQLLVESIKDHIQRQFETYHTLLQTPARKLSQEEKSLKKELRKGKSILVKAFAKSRSFPSIYDLLSNESRHWISVLHPLFLCSPYTVARSLPVNKKFTLVIFDEASQIPLPHAIGGLQRAERVVVAGDQEQMAPHFYFQKRSSKMHDLLHQASYYWKNQLLSNHYRSEHEDLIAFSNRYFYEDRLTPFPVPESKNPITIIEANGSFIDRKNKEEAKRAAGLIKKSLKNKENIGLVAFSKNQLSAILDELPSELQDQILEENQPGFVQSLENVQGDQCDHLVISLGYAKNENGDFHMRFGPLNEEQGHRRLNVLMSRAKKKITFIRSVKSSDFKISDNEGVEMLRKLMLFLEEERNEVNHSFSKGISTTGNKLLIEHPQHVFESSLAFINYYLVMKNRGWNITIKL